MATAAHHASHWQPGHESLTVTVLGRSSPARPGPGAARAPDWSLTREWAESESAAGGH